VCVSGTVCISGFVCARVHPIIPLQTEDSNEDGDGAAAIEDDDDSNEVAILTIMSWPTAKKLELAQSILVS
jgi:hypothetical protein